MPRDRPPLVRHEARPRRISGGMAAVLLAWALTACTPGNPDTTPEPSATAGDPQSSTDATPMAEPEPTLVPEGTASDNRPLFAAVTAEVWASENRVAGRAYIDALAAAGFDKAAMQVTDDQTTVRNPAESIQFSVRWGDECLIGQVGPATGEPVTAVVPVLAEGTCLVGETRPIDW